MREIDISSYSIEQLQSLHKSLRQEVEVLTQNMGSLKMVKGKFEGASRAVGELDRKLEGQMQRSPNRRSDVHAGSTLLVPLTSSLYVPGPLKRHHGLR